MEDVYEKAVEPGAHKSNFEYVHKTISDKTYIGVKDGCTIILSSTKFVPDPILIETAESIRERINADEGSFFITSYLTEK